VQRRRAGPGQRAITLPAIPDIEAQIKALTEGVFVEYSCHDCGEGYGDTKPARCPKCGSYAIEEIKRVEVEKSELVNPAVAGCRFLRH